MPDGSITDRLDWIHAVCLRCSDRAIKVAAIINLRWNRQAGCAWPSHASLATDMGSSVDTVMRALKELKTIGAVEVKESRGRGLANEYRPVWSFGVKPPQTCPPFTEKTPAELQGLSTEKPPQPCGENPRNSADKTPATLPPPTHIKNSAKELSEEPAAASEEKTDLFDHPEQEPEPITDRQLIQPLAGMVRWTTNDQERTAANVAELATLVRTFGAQAVERIARGLFTSTGSKVWPDALGPPLAAERSARRIPKPPPPPPDWTPRKKP